ncbi:PAS domain S-box protein [Aurantibacter crassamenti]|uniref:PAS domain-containing sensor histidine kinase n=1 Tax=Aurantibacter crassamenti TaxID=1837375 RepID=UPI00193A68FD|nr:PAS domain-containing sensor histidine kinase [Aurantibacter crassamenti]MBM1107478.1 PAS domain S-box protein [Aurantibacter crassamenti]
MDNKEVLLLKKALERQKKARAQAEKILEEKSKELYDTAFHLKESNARLENLLSEKTNKLEGVFTNILDPYVVVDLHMNIIEMNSAAKEFLGYDIEKEKINLSALIPSEYLDYNLEAMQTLRELGVLKNYRSKIILKDKSERFVHINGSLVYDKNNVPIAAQGIIRDITKDTEIKNLLAEQKKELDIIVENSPLGIVLKQSGIIITANKTFKNLLGYSENELKNRPVDEISIPEDSDKLNELNNQMEAGLIDNFTVVKKYFRKDGTNIWAKTSVNAFKDTCGKVKYQVAMIEDISAQHNLEKEREILLKELEESNKGLQEYAHIVSHDLKSPLRSISALSTWLYEDYKNVLDENGVSQLNMMQEKVEAMDKLIDGILKYSTVSSDVVDNTQVDVNEVIKEITDIIYIPDHVQVKIVKKLPTLYADKTKIHQLFQNFLSNAVVHIEREVGLVNIDYKETATHWQFSIEDNGVGIPKEYHEKIFKIFESVGNKERSTGIGLSIVKKIIDLYEGLVWLESDPNTGTTFYFTLKKQS